MCIKTSFGSNLSNISWKLFLQCERQCSVTIASFFLPVPICFCTLSFSALWNSAASRELAHYQHLLSWLWHYKCQEASQNSNLWRKCIPLSISTIFNGHLTTVSKQGIGGDQRSLQMSMQTFVMGVLWQDDSWYLDYFTFSLIVHTQKMNY